MSCFCSGPLKFNFSCGGVVCSTSVFPAKTSQHVCCDKGMKNEKQGDNLLINPVQSRYTFSSCEYFRMLGWFRLDRTSVTPWEDSFREIKNTGDLFMTVSSQNVTAAPAVTLQTNVVVFAFFVYLYAYLVRLKIYTS